MIYRITKKEYDNIRKARKRGYGASGVEQCLLFKGENGWYYKETAVGMVGVKNVVEYKKKIKEQMKPQGNLL